jgi:Tfp pilus assembly protein PilF
VGNAVTSYVRYLGKMFWSADLAIVYPHPAKHYFLSDAWPGWQVAAAALLLILISIFCLTQLRRRPYLAMGWFWFLGTLVPVIGLVQVGEQAMADRYTYIPLIGPAISLVWWASDSISLSYVAKVFNLLYRRFVIGRAATVHESSERADGRQFCAKASPVGILIIAGALACLTRHQLGYWRNTVTLFEHAVAVTGDNPSAQFALGVGLEHEGLASRGMVQYRVAVAIDPHYAKAYYNMGQVLRKAGKWQEAADAYQAALRSNPTDLPTQLNLANVLPHLGRTREAIDHFSRALELDPNSLEGLNNLAWVLSTSGDAAARDGARAVQLAERACFLSGYKVSVFLGTLAAAYAEAGRFEEAVATAQRAGALATETGDLAAASKNQELLARYRLNKPYHEER